MANRRGLKRVAVLLEGRSAYERAVLQGIRRAAEEGRRWVLRLLTPGRRQVIKILRNWQPHGVLVQGWEVSGRFLDGLRAADARVVSCAYEPAEGRLACAGIDNEQVGEAAAAFLLEKGPSTYAFAEPGGRLFATVRGRSFSTAIEAESGGGVRWSRRRGEESLVSWLRKLPKPCGLLASTDQYAFHLAGLCQENGIRIPEDILLLGVDNDELVCELAVPSLSTVAVPAERVGYEAAVLLERYMAGRLKRKVRILLPPTGIIARGSTDVPRTDDALVNRALEFMQMHAVKRITVSDVLREVHVCRRSLERRFARVVGRSPLQEIIHVRMDLARRLLRQTDLNLEHVARRCGYVTAAQFIAAFRKVEGVTPGRYRRRTSG
jgi:LacI family transcriptional regulator